MRGCVLGVFNALNNCARHSNASDAHMLWYSVTLYNGSDAHAPLPDAAALSCGVHEHNATHAIRVI